MQWLRVARIGWVAVALLSVALWIAATPTEWHRLETVCRVAGQTSVCPEPHLTPRALHQLQSLGFSRDAFAAFFLGVDALFAALFVVIGVLVVRRRPEEPIALLAGYFLVPFGAAQAVDAHTFAAAYPLLQWPALSIQAVGAAAVFPFLYLFPDGRFVPRWTGWLAAGMAALLVLDTYAPADGINPDGVLSEMLTVGGVMAAAGVLFSQIYRYRRVSGPTQRQQAKWPMLGIATALIGLAFILVSQTISGSGLSGLASIVVGNLVWYGLVSLVPLSLALAILRYHLWDIDVILNRTLVYGTLTTSVVGLYVLIVVGLGALVQARGNLLLSLLATGIVAVLFQQVRTRLQRGVNRLMYGQRDEPYAVVSRLGRQLEATLAPNTALPSIVETVAQALKLPYVAIALKQDDAFVVAAAVGPPAYEPVHLPLLYQGEMVGELVLGTRAGEAAFSAPDRRLLEDLSRQAGAAVYAVRLTADLQLSRQRLVTAREEERRRLRRDLHDGLGPSLAAQTLKVGSARALYPHDPATADALLAELEDDMGASLANVRRLVYNLRPPALDELGLVGALRDSVAHYRKRTGERDEGLSIKVDAPDDLPSLPAAVEVAAYRIAQEALTNVVRHAHARRCQIRLQVRSEGDRTMLDLTIVDDGVGLAAERKAGVGLASMRERAAELGGALGIETRPEGETRVHAQLPLGSTPSLTAGVPEAEATRQPADTEIAHLQRLARH